MTLPAFLFGVVLSSLYGALFHLWRGGGPGRILLYVLLAWAGFWAGHFGGIWIGWEFWTIGPLNAGPATLGSLVVLLIGHWLSLVEISRE